MKVAADKLWGAQTQRSLEHFGIGLHLIPREMIAAYATLKKGAAIANHAGKRLDDERFRLIVQTCNEILAGEHYDMFPLHVWMTGSGTQFNMNMNEVISNRCCQLAGTPLGSKTPVHPNDHVNMSQSSNDSFPAAMNIAAAVNVKEQLLRRLNGIARRDRSQGRGMERRGQDRPHSYAGRDSAHVWTGMVRLCWYAQRQSRSYRVWPERGLSARAGRRRAVGTGINAAPGFGEAAAAEIAKLTKLPIR